MLLAGCEKESIKVEVDTERVDMLTPEKGVVSPPTVVDPRLELSGMVKDEPVGGLEPVVIVADCGVDWADVDKVEVLEGEVGV